MLTLFAVGLMAAGLGLGGMAWEWLLDRSPALERALERLMSR